MSSDIRFDQNNITTVVDEQNFESTNGDEFLKITRTTTGAKIEGRDPSASQTTAVLDLNFEAPFTPKGSRIQLMNENGASIDLRASDGNISVNNGINYSTLKPTEVITPHVDAGTSYTKEARVEDELYFESDSGERIIVVRKSDDVQGQLQIKHSQTLTLSAQSSNGGGSVVLYDGDGTPTIILDGKTGDIYLSGSLNEGVDPSVMQDIESALVWGD